MRRYFAILTILLLGFSVQFSLGQPEEEKAETESREPVKTQEGRAEKSENAPKELGESRRQPDRERSRTNWRGAVERLRNASPEERRKMRGEFVRRLRSRGGNMERRGNGQETDFQQRERDMEMERREQEHQFQLERMQKEHEVEMERLEQDRIREMRQHGAPSLDFELPDDEMSDEQREKIQLIRFRLEQQEIQKMAEIQILENEAKIALQQQFFSQKMAETKPIEELIKAIAILQSEIKILEIKAMVEFKSLLNPEQLKHLINQSKETH